VPPELNEMAVNHKEEQGIESLQSQREAMLDGLVKEEMKQNTYLRDTSSHSSSFL